MTKPAPQNSPKQPPADPEDALSLASDSLRETLALTLALTSEGAEPEALLNLLDQRAHSLDKHERALGALDAGARARLEPLRAEVIAAEDRAMAALHARRDRAGVGGAARSPGRHRRRTGLAARLPLRRPRVHRRGARPCRPPLSGPRRVIPGAPTISPPGATSGLSATDLSELFASFAEATRGLERTHEALRAEVARLQDELREANEQLQRTRALAALGEMAAGIAHEVRNPLAAVALRARLLEADLAHDPSLCSAAKAIGAAVKQADAVVADVLAFARQAPLRLERISAHDALRDAAEACSHLLAARPWLSLEIEPEGREASPRLTCDASLLRQALVNIIRNAVEALEEARARARGEPASPARITLSAERRRPLDSSGERAPMIALRVRDTGPGLPAGAAERVFNPFFTTRDTGTGLGLAIVHRIADAHAGRVRAMNARDVPGSAPHARGAVVEILLPDSEPDHASPVPASAKERTS